jgi:hypothetical protein
MKCSPACGRGVQLARHLGRGRGVVDEDGARRHAGQGTVRAQHDGPQVVVVADAGEHELGSRAASHGVDAARPPCPAPGTGLGGVRL